VIETDSHYRAGRRIVTVLVFVFMAVVLHLVIRQYYPPNIDRSKWLVAIGLLAARNAFVGAAIGAMIKRAWIGFVVGLAVPPIAVVMLYGLPG